jgi:hypothetical protein
LRAGQKIHFAENPNMVAGALQAAAQTVIATAERAADLIKGSG